MKDFGYIVAEDLNKIEAKISNLVTNESDVFNDLELFISEKSKRISSIFSLLYLKLNNTEINDKLINLLSAGELIHNASLLHDDVIDDADLRRGSITLSNKYNSKIAILSGDYLLSFAVECLAQLDNKDILNIFINTTKLMSEAEISQYFLRNKEVTFEEYLKIIYGKTASLFEGILSSASILSGIDVNCAKEFGKNFGLLFQINNDMNHYSKENDEKNGIKTVIDILGIEKTNVLKDNYKQKMREDLNKYSDSQYRRGLEDLINLL